MPNSLTFFAVTGSYLDVRQPIVDEGDQTPEVTEVSAYVDFFPGSQLKAVEGGLVLYVPDFETYGDTQLAIAPITGRTINGKLCTIAVGDPESVELVANSAWLDYGEGPLFYHVRYRNVTYGGAIQRLPNFAFQAPTDSTGVLLTDPDLQRFDYRGP